MISRELIFKALGDRGLFIKFGDSIDRKIKKKIEELEIAISTRGIDGIIETIPGYCSLLVLYDPLQSSFESLRDKIKDLNYGLDTFGSKETRTIDIPVIYGGEFGPDLKFVADYHHVSEEEIIRIHTSTFYTVYLLGTTGFAFLGDLIEEIHTPRLETPRALVPAGSVGIGNSQTGIFAVDGPSGWRIIGRTSVPIYNPGKEMPVFLRPGDNIRFVRVINTGG